MAVGQDIKITTGREIAAADYGLKRKGKGMLSRHCDARKLVSLGGKPMLECG